MRTTLIPALLLSAAGLVAQEIAKPAPELRWTATFNFGDLPTGSLAELQESVVLLEFISVQQKTTAGEVGKLDSMYAQLGEKGLVVISVTSEAVEDVKKWVEKHGVKRPVACGFNKAYDVFSVPDAFLIDKDGKLLWHGSTSALERPLVDNALVGATPAVVVAGLEEVAALRRSKDFGGTYTKAQKLLGGGQLSELAQVQAKRWCERYEREVATATADAAKADGEGDLFRVWSLLDPIARYYQGVPGAEAAKTRVDALMADKKVMREIEAGRAVAEAKAKEAEQDYDAAFTLYKAAAQKFGNTRAGKAAGVSAKDLETKGLLGYDARCPYCKAAEKACPQHDPKKKKRK
ncbi:MAG: peroxiredoxin family protein [Planctomycetes bacterium]|nr:peroxiredoxin family protein [Planctomycetota bacterium]MCC7396914.1 redoxin domain-containing protein [Planctomycetota bacterium]